MPAARGARRLSKGRQRAPRLPRAMACRWSFVRLFSLSIARLRPNLWPSCALPLPVIERWIFVRLLSPSLVYATPSARDLASDLGHLQYRCRVWFEPACVSSRTMMKNIAALALVLLPTLVAGCATDPNSPDDDITKSDKFRPETCKQIADNVASAKDGEYTLY